MAEDDHVEMELRSKDLDLIRDMASDPQGQFTLGQARRVSGFGESFGELVVVLGIASFPAGVGASLLANWIWKHLERRKGVSVRAEIRCGDRRVELELTGDNAEAVTAAIAGAVANVVEQ